MNNIKYLDMYGLRGKTEFCPTIFDNNRIEVIRSIIKANYVPIKSIMRHRSSYGLKHDIEKRKEAECIGNYLSNGELIYAMHLEGYNLIPTYDGSPNAYFNVSYKSVRELRGEKTPRELYSLEKKRRKEERAAINAEFKELEERLKAKRSCVAKGSTSSKR